MANEVRILKFSNDVNFETILNSHCDLVAAACASKFPGLINASELSVSEYKELNEDVKKAMYKFAAEKAGVGEIKDETDMLYANDNPTFRNVLNTIVVRTLGEMMARYENPQIGAIAEIETVNAGDSKTYEIDTKALPVFQRGTYGSNLTLVPSYAKGAVTITPKVYTGGVSLDFIRLLANGYDWGYAVARVYAGIIYAQYALVVSKVFSTTVLASPLYQSTFALGTYTQLAEDIGMLNGGGSNNVVALGTRTAFNTISGIAVNGGFATKDEYIRGSYVKEISGVNSVIMEQFTNLAAPFNSTNASSLRAIPNNLIVLVSEGKDKPVKLVRENYIRAIEVPANDNTLNRMEYSFFQAFDADIATSSFFGVQNTASV